MSLTIHCKYNSNTLILLHRELKTDGKSFIFAVCRLPFAVNVMLNLSNSNLGQLLHFRQKYWKLGKEGMGTCNFMAKFYLILDSIDTPNCFLLWKPDLNDGLGEHAAQGIGNATCTRIANY